MVNAALSMLVLETILEIDWDAKYAGVTAVSTGRYLYYGYDTGQAVGLQDSDATQAIVPRPHADVEDATKLRGGGAVSGGIGASGAAVGGRSAESTIGCRGGGSGAFVVVEDRLLEERHRGSGDGG